MNSSTKQLQSKEHIKAKQTVQNLKHKTSSNNKIRRYLEFLGINDDSLDLDEVKEAIKDVQGNS
jgi:hypothetical protein